VSAEAFWLKWPKVRGCDTKVARNSPSGASFSSFFTSHPKQKILAENFVLHLCSPLSHFFCLITGTKSAFHQEKKRWKNCGHRKMKETGFLPIDMLDL